MANKTFNTVVTPLLYLELDIGKKGTQSLRTVAGSEYNLIHVKRLSVEGGMNDDEYHEIVRQMLPKMPSLESFTYVYARRFANTLLDWPNTDSNTWAWSRWHNIPLAMTTLMTLRTACKKVKAIHLTFPENMDERVLGYKFDQEYDPPEPSQLEAREIYERPDLTVFTGLEELTLDGLYGDFLWWKEHLIKIFKNSPGLRKLQLSLSVHKIALYERSEEREIFDGFFDGLCDDYGKTGAAPLHLQSLKLGTALYPYELHSIEKLTDLSYLQDVYVRNSGVSQDVDIILVYDSPNEESGIAFHAFSPVRCPNLRRFTAANYEGDVHKEFAAIEDPSFARQLAISCVQMGSPQELAALLRADPGHPSLPLHLRMLDIDLQRDQVCLCDEDGEQLPDEDVPTAQQVLEDLVSNDEGTLRGLMVHLSEDSDAASGFEHLDLLCTALGKLVNITQLGIERYRFHQTQLTDEALVRVTHALAAAAPQLRYIKVYQHYWRIWRIRDGTISLEELEDREIGDVELFADTVWEPDTY